jgi:1-acyl-sn-glycerol-3-phosphate acyltransferase
MSKEKNFGYKFVRDVFGPVWSFYYNAKVVGQENIPEDGSIVVVGNHIHIMDQCPAILSTKRMLHYMAKKEYFDGHFAWFFKMMGCISVNRSIHDNEAKEKAMNVLKDDKALGIFPEGTRNKTKEFLLPFKFGAVSMAKKTNAYILPVGITGEYKFRSKDLTIRIGKPFKIDNLELEEANEKLKDEISNLMKENIK